jgi:predicted DNA-binding transcriptional regulator YafY
VLKNKDSSFVKEFGEAINKIKSVLRHATQNKINLLSERILIRKNVMDGRASNYLAAFQKAITDFTVITINYQKANSQDVTVRNIEPFAVYHSVEENWLLIAYCRLRKDMRAFRFDRILKMDVLTTTFEPQKMTLSEFIDSQKIKQHP